MAELPLNQMKLTADSMRMLALDAVNKARSGHTGTAMALSDLTTVLFTQFMRFDPTRPDWANRDRFVLSPGHASMLLYSILHLAGYEVSLDDIKNFRQWGSNTPGHPEVGVTPGVEVTTGPLGQGISTAVGMAVAEAHLAAQYNRPDFNVVDHYTYVIASDGDIMEGVSHEAAALAAHWGLSKLVVFFDDNRITIDGTTAISSSEDVAARFAAYGWNVLKVEDGHDMSQLHAAIEAAHAESARPTFISMRTHIGIGTPAVDTSKAHGALVGDEMVSATKAHYNWDETPFMVPGDVYEFMHDRVSAAAQAYTSWAEMFEGYVRAYPDLGAAFVRTQKGQLPDGWEENLPIFGEDVKQATRAASGKVLAGLVPAIRDMMGGSADLTGSNKTIVTDMGKFHEDKAGRYLYFGIREHGMGAILNGMALHGGVRPYGGTFLVFSDYMRGAIRLGALSHIPVTWVFTHDSIGLGEDGPTHQPIEHVMSLRAIPNLTVVRPADGNETAAAWRIALERRDGPTALILTRQKLPTIPESTAGAIRGGYILRDADNPQAIIMATGSEVEIALNAQATLAEGGIAARVVSMPSWELFDAQSAEYKSAVLPTHITARVSVEAGTTFGWERYVGQFGRSVGIDHFGGSAPYQTLYKEFGITAEAVVDAVREMLG